MLTFNRVGSIWNKFDPEQRLRVAVLGRTVRPAFLPDYPIMHHRGCPSATPLRIPLP